MMINLQTDILIIGGGIAGFSLAINLAKDNNKKDIIILIKDVPYNSSTYLAQGGIASSPNEKGSIEKHIKDTLIAGDYKNKKKIVQYVIQNSYKAIEFLKDIGVRFDTDLLLEGGHSEKRVYHFKDITGKEILEKLIEESCKYNNIKVLNKYYALDLITKNENSCYGAKVYSVENKSNVYIFAHKTVIATGGVGQIYENTTNPSISCGDGLYLAIRNKVEVKDIDFIQFHPTVLCLEKGIENNFLISESVRGEGGFLENIKGERFMKKYDIREDLAPRDIISRAIFREMDITNSDNVFLNISGIKDFDIKFPNIFKYIKKFDIGTKIPVSPMAHYLCGGIKVNKNSETSMNNLYALGEVANTGFHGSNRLASNSLLEAVVFSMDFKESKNSIKKNILDSKDYCSYEILYVKNKILTELKNRLKYVMQKYMGIEKSTFSIKKAHEEVLNIKESLKEHSRNNICLDYIELEKMVTVSEKMIMESKERKNNTGVFYNKDLK